MSKMKKILTPVVPPVDQPSNLKCGFVSIIGRPNTGKSTLLNALVGEKVAIVSPIPQTTRTAVKGILTDKRGQIVFLDTPGWHIGRDSLDRYMNQSCLNAIEGVDCIVYLVDSSEQTGEEEFRIVSRLKNAKVPVILGFNKIDLKGDYVPEYIKLWEEAKGKPVTEMENFVMLPLSGRDGTHVDKLIDIIFNFLPTGPFFYEADVVTDTPKKLVISDIIREKLFLQMREEVPHSIAVHIEEVRPAKGKTTYVRAVIMVERDSQKEIVIGKKGQVLKEIGTLARQELETLMETKVFLELFVKSQKNWRDDRSMLEDMGYTF